MYKLLFEKFLQQFIKAVGRKPQTTKELMSIQDDVVRYLNKTKGVPEGPKKPPFQGFTPEVIQGGKSKEGITSIPVNKQIQDLKTFEREVIDELNAPIQPDLKVVPKLSKKERIFEIDDELEKLVAKEGKYGKMNRNEREDLMIKLQDESSMLQEKTLLKDSSEAIAKIKAENKAAIKRLNDKKKTVEDFRDDGDWDPSGMASGGLARVGFGAGELVKPKNWKLVRDFIEKLFMKASNDIRLGKGKWKGLNQDQWIKQHDDLTKMLKKWEWSGKKRLPEGASEYLGMNDLQISRAIKEAEKKVLSKPKKTLEGIKKEGTIDISDPEVADEFTTFIKESDPKGYKDLEQKIELESFDIKGKKGHASGGRAGSGLNYLLGEDDQNVRMPYGGLPGLLGE